MKKMKKFLEAAIVITVVLAFVLPSSAVFTNEKNTTEKSIVRTIKSENNFLEMYPATIHSVSSHDLNYVSNEMNTNTIGTDIPIMVYPEEIDIENPNLLDNMGNTIIAIAEANLDVTTSTPFLRYSNDGGNNWLPEDDFLTWTGMEDYIEEQPCIDFAGDNGGFGSMIPYDPLTLFTIDFDDVSDPEVGDQWSMTGWNTDEELDSLDVCGVTSEFSPDTYARGMVVRTGDDVGGQTNILYIGWREGEDTLRGLWTGNSDDLLEWENVDCDVDLVTGLHFETYEVYDYEGYPDGVELDWCQMDGTGDWWLGDWYWTGGIIEGAINPDVKADDGNVYLVYEIDGSIYCLYSNDNTENFYEVMITDNGHLPTITAIGETAVCSYIRDDDLYTSISEDGGANWDDETQVNDESGSLVDQQNCNDVSGAYVAWTDNRNPDQNSIYFDITLQIGNAPGAPTISGRTTGGAGKTYEYTFTATDPDGDDIAEYQVDWGDGSTQALVGPFASGEGAKASHSWEEGSYVIKAKAKDINGLLGPQGSLSISMPRSRAVFTPFFRFLQDYPNLFPILRHILGL